MEIRVLGALDVRVCGVSVVPSAPKPRQVLGVLALRADQVVPAGVLADELWSGRPPRSARTTVQTYVLQLRDLIDRALTRAASTAGATAGSTAGSTAGVSCAKDILVTSPGGYMLNSGGGVTDVREFERLAGMGYRAMDAEDHPLAARQLGEALALWRGPAFADVPVGGQLAVEAKRLEETRLCALDQRIDVDLRLGRHRVLLAELTVLVDRYRTHESLHGQYMVALHRSGRRGEALEAYQRLRNTLVRELGMEPSVGLRRLQRSILLAAPERAEREPAAVTSTATAGTTVAAAAAAAAGVTAGPEVAAARLGMAGLSRVG
ncbi:AfsR/SARP family transcriptional regulator [Streptomyces sp. NRRL S-350]|uniref:AfsR/SARP family transcriptional regulator n=1 Tax=Streptomyces sp. NRRL S-350 TaxID=1463902 RepID=UPI00099B5BD6|nr:AfsR/SARP family transcriptional regulator [Streptomyces sp. NRRL S-350]